MIFWRAIHLKSVFTLIQIFINKIVRVYTNGMQMHCVLDIFPPNFDRFAWKLLNYFLFRLNIVKVKRRDCSRSNMAEGRKSTKEKWVPLTCRTEDIKQFQCQLITWTTFAECKSFYCLFHTKVYHYVTICPMQKWSITYWNIFG